MSAAFVSVILLSLVASAASETVSYLWVYRSDYFQNLKQKIVQCEQRLDDEMRAAPTGAGKARQRRIESTKVQIKTARDRAAGQQMRTTLVAAVFQLIGAYMIGSMYAGQSVATLPFEPIGPFRSLTQRGLPEGSASNACSATFVFILGGLVFKAVFDRSLSLGMPRANSLPKWVTNPEEVIGVGGGTK